MFPGELAQNVVPVETSFIKPYNISITWCDPPSDTRDLFRAYSLMLGESSESVTNLTFDDMPAMGLTMFNDSRLLLYVAENLSGSTNVEKVRGWQIQEGKKAMILQWEFMIDGNPYYGVQYVSKGDFGTRLDQEANADFQNLYFLYEQTQLHLTHEGQELFSVAKPFANEYVSYNGHHYFTFFMPFAEGYGELQVDSFGTTQLPEATLWFRYALAYSNDMQETIEMQARLGPMLAAQDAKEALRRYGIHLATDRSLSTRQQEKLNRSITHIIASLNEKPSIQRLARQRFDVETALALIHILSGGLMPRDFGINRGDFMVQFPEDAATDAGLKLHLISVNGGFTQPMSPLEWVSWMRLHEESVARDINPDATDMDFVIHALSHGHLVQPFAHESAGQLARAYHRAQSMIHS